MTQALVAFGANLGNPWQTYAKAIDILASSPGIKIARKSPLYQTEPVGGPDAHLLYLNGAFLLETSLAPPSLFQELQGVQHQLGRTNHEHWGPRPIDLDLIWIEDTVYVTKDLTIPHPRMHHRWFVLQPVADIAPDVRHPLLQQSMEELRQGISQRPLNLHFLGGSPSLIEQCREELSRRAFAGASPHCPVLPPDVTFQQLGNQIVGLQMSRLGADHEGQARWQVVFIDHDEPSTINDRSLFPAVDARADDDSGRLKLFRFFLDSLRPGSPFSHEESI